MNRNQKIALGCGGAGCLGLIVVIIGIGLFVFFRAGRLSEISDGNHNFNVNSNRSDSSSNANENDNSTSSSSSATSMSDDDKHKLFHAANVTSDTELIHKVWKKLGLTDADNVPNDNYAEFTKDHIGWVFRNTDFLQEISTPDKARAYVDAHIDD
jgi:hypothetical protein